MKDDCQAEERHKKSNQRGVHLRRTAAFCSGHVLEKKLCRDREKERVKRKRKNMLEILKPKRSNCKPANRECCHKQTKRNKSVFGTKQKFTF